MSHTTPSLPAAPHVLAVDIGGTKVDAALVSVVAGLVRAEVRVRGFAVRRPSLEERFVELTGEGFDVER